MCAFLPGTSDWCPGGGGGGRPSGLHEIERTRAALGCSAPQAAGSTAGDCLPSPVRVLPRSLAEEEGRRREPWGGEGVFSRRRGTSQTLASRAGGEGRRPSLEPEPRGPGGVRGVRVVLPPGRSLRELGSGQQAGHRCLRLRSWPQVVAHERVGQGLCKAGRAGEGWPGEARGCTGQRGKVQGNGGQNGARVGGS